VFKEIYEESGRVDLVFANAGVSEIGKFLENDGEGEPKKPGFKTLDVNLTGTLYCESVA
jgi:NADP-dependent 3-hydroxy acid dehydrogenase YdfG